MDVPEQLAIATVPAEDETAQRLLRAMESEVDRLYRDREGSIHAITASQSELSPPDGAVLLIRAAHEAIACGYLKRLDSEVCEIKRMYVEPAWRGRGVARVLLEGLEAKARELGYRRARLDTGDRQPAAKHLYVTAGYREIPDYNRNPLARHWFEREL